MEGEENKGWQRYREAITASIELMRRDCNREALQLLDEAIAPAISDGENRWVLTLSHHAAVISHFLKDSPKEKHYY